MNENSSPVVKPAASVAGNGPGAKPAGTAPSPGTLPQPSAPVAGPVPAPAKPPALFGGHRGGGKKRADGLVAGSPEARAADKEKDAARKRGERAEKKVAELPPALPGVVAAAPGAAAPLAAGQPADGAAVGSAATGAAVVPPPTAVAWTLTMLQRPIRVLMKIVDRVRCGALMTRIRKLKLSKEDEAEAEKRIAYKAEQIEAFNAALANVAVIELNKRRIGGAQHSHWLELGMTAGDLMNSHMDTVDWLETKILAKATAEKILEIVESEKAATLN